MMSSKSAALAVLAFTKINMAAHSGSVDEELMKKTEATSIIWTWFGFKVSDNEQQNIICKICRVTILAKHLFYHLKTKDATEYAERQRMLLTLRN